MTCRQKKHFLINRLAKWKLWWHFARQRQFELLLSYPSHELSSYNLSCKTPLHSSSESDFRFVWRFVLSLLWLLGYYTCIMYLLLLVHLILIIPWTINIYVSLYSPCLVVSLQIIQHKHGVLYPCYITSWYSVKNPWIKVSS